ncbi:unnamed protein product [Dicrocoelium dendriticum]|nr:unnamed protein product [Dicrocoelium dendriticum]
MGEVEALIGFKDLAENDTKYASLLHDSTCLHGLVLLLSNNNHEIVLHVLQILLTLSKRPRGSSILSRVLVQVANEEDVIVTLAKHLYEQVFVTRDDRLKNKEMLEPMTHLKPKTVALRLYGVQHDTDIEAIRHALLRIRGVVSITFQLHKNRVIVCTVPDLNPEVLLQAVRSASSFHDGADTARDSAFSETDQSFGKGVKAKIIRKRSEIHRTGSFIQGRRATSRRESLPVPEMPAYLEENADLFEVDESRAAPKLRTQVCTNDGTDGDGLVSRLSSFLERSFFW